MFQHTYKGSKLTSFTSEKRSLISSSIPTRVRNVFSVIVTPTPYYSSSIPTRVRNHSSHLKSFLHNSCSSIPTRVRNSLTIPSTPSLRIRSSIPTRVRNYRDRPMRDPQLLVPAYLQGFETNTWYKTFSRCQSVPAYLQGFETRNSIQWQHCNAVLFQHTYKGSKPECTHGNFINFHQFQHTYKGSKPMLSPLQAYRKLSSSIPTRVRNYPYPFETWIFQVSSSIPTRVRNRKRIYGSQN